jgi:hypothetical protein
MFPTHIKVTLYPTKRERIGESRVLVARAIYAPKLNYAEIITAYHHLANVLECAGQNDLAILIDQIIAGYQMLSDANSPHQTPS